MSQRRTGRCRRAISTQLLVTTYAEILHTLQFLRLGNFGVLRERKAVDATGPLP